MVSAEGRTVSGNRFDQAAAAWEDKPQRLALASAVAEAIRRLLPALSQSLTALEYGCGTGLVSRALSPSLASITAMDSSSAMLEELQQRVRLAAIDNIHPRLHDLTSATLDGALYDVVYSSMTLHHIQDSAVLLGRFFALLRPGGLLALADLAPEDGTFHEDNTGVAHFGIDPQWLLACFAQNGGVDGEWREVHSIEKNGRRYAIVLSWCRKG